MTNYKPKIILTLFLGLACFAFADVTFAEDIASVSSRVTNQAKSLGGMVKMIVLLVGFIAVAMGINGIIQAKKRQEGLGTPLTILVIGIAMLSVVVVAKVGSQSAFGTDGDINQLVN